MTDVVSVAGRFCLFGDRFCVLFHRPRIFIGIGASFFLQKMDYKTRDRIFYSKDEVYQVIGGKFIPKGTRLPRKLTTQQKKCFPALITMSCFAFMRSPSIAEKKQISFSSDTKYFQKILQLYVQVSTGIALMRRTITGRI